MSFLTAEWRKLAIANYEVEPSLLEGFLPPGTELDIWRGRCYASLVGFMFKQVRVLGFRVPFHTEFEEVNLRFYVRHRAQGEWRRGVVFVREFVPKAAVTWVANTLYQEHYETLPMGHHWRQRGDGNQEIGYDWEKNGRRHSFHLDAGLVPQAMPPGSESEFITEHYWGYTKNGNGQSTLEYQVTHPRWEVYKVNKHAIDVDFGLLYGQHFEPLNLLRPSSVMLAEGSAITIEKKRRI